MPFSSPARGILAAMAHAKESTYGTSAAASFANYLKAVSLGGPDQTPTRQRRAHLYGGAALFPRDTYDGQIEAGGPMRLEALYDGLGLILEGMTGGTPSSSLVAGTQYAHVFTPSMNLPSYTVRGLMGTGTEATGLGGMINRATFSASAGEQAFWELDWIFQKLDGPTRAAYGTTTPTFGTGQTPILGHQLSGFDWNGQTPTPIDLQFTLDNRIERRNRLGSLYTAQPIVSDFREAVIRATLEWDRDDFWDALQAGDTGAAQVVFTGNGDDEFQIDLVKSYVRAAGTPVDGPGIVRQTVEIVALAQTGSDTVTLTARNDSSAYDSNG